jgi:thermitase
MIFRKIQILLAAVFLFSLASRASDSLVWNTANDVVTADVRGKALWPLLEDIAHQTGWHIFVEPGLDQRKIDVKFTALQRGEALKKLLGDLNFAFVPQATGPDFLYVFATTMRNATRPVGADSNSGKKAPAKRVANELLVKVKPGTDIDALAKSLGAKVVGRDDALGLYRLQFNDEAAMEAALAQLKNNPSVEAVDYNYYFDAPLKPQPLANPPANQTKLTLDSTQPNDPCHPIVAVIDTQVQSLGSDLDKFVMKPVYVVDNPSPQVGVTHGTAMVSAALDAIGQSSGGTSAVKILPVVVYDGGEQTTSWYVARGVQAAVNNGATVLNLSLGGSSDSAVLDDIIQQALKKGVVIFAAAGNQPVTTPTYPAAIPGVIAVTALIAPGQLAPYANYGSFVSMALPGANVVREGNQTYVMQGTSTATAYASGVAAGTRGVNCDTWPQIQNAMQQKFPVPKK